jgi:hypothetical protein
VNGHTELTSRSCCHPLCMHAVLALYATVEPGLPWLQCVYSSACSLCFGGVSGQRWLEYTFLSRLQWEQPIPDMGVRAALQSARSYG